MGKILYSVIAVLEFGSFSAMAEPQRPIVAVFRIEDRTRTLTKEQVEQYTEYLGTSIAKGGTYRRVPSDQVVRALLEQSKKSHKECYDQGCQIELGQELSANKSLSTRVMKLGDKCTVTSDLFDNEKKATDMSASSEVVCKEAELKRAFEKVAADVRAFGERIAQSPPMASPSPQSGDPAKKKRVVRLMELKYIQGPKEYEWTTKSVLSDLEVAMAKSSRFEILSSTHDAQKREVAAAYENEDFMDESSVPEIGKMRMADAVGVGSIQVVGEEMLIHVKIVDISTEKTIADAQVKGKVGELSAHVETLVKNLDQSRK